MLPLLGVRGSGKCTFLSDYIVISSRTEIMLACNMLLLGKIAGR